MPIRTGIDIASISRVQNLLDEYGSHFKQRFFSRYEEKYGNNKFNSAQTYAGMWAAKEAVFKVLGKGKRWNDIFIDHESSGRPRIRVATELLDRPYINIPLDADWDCSIAHDADLAVATATCFWNGGSRA